MSTVEETTSSQATNSRLYRAVWRWHFYAGLYVIPFLLMLAITGLVMLYASSIESQFGKIYHVSPDGPKMTLATQAQAALKAVPDGVVSTYIAPRSPDLANIFVVTAGGKQHFVAVDPHEAKVLADVVKDDTWFYWARAIHGSFLIGQPSAGWGDHLIEVAAGLSIILILSGIYMWWPRGNKGFLAALVPDLSRTGRGLWKELHVTGGLYVSVILLAFLISGLSWTGFWGGNYVQLWNTFPANKYAAPKSDKTHASLNHGALKEVPWTLEHTPMPKSGSLMGAPGLAEGTPVNLDTVAAFARGYGFDEQFRVSPPSDEEGVYTVMADSMNQDNTSPFKDRTLHIDQYTGKVLADIPFAVYPLGGKAMAVGIALHEAGMGLWNLVFNTVYCLLIIFICLSGIVMWWKRRPARALGSPLYAKNTKVPVAVLGLGAVLCAIFPLSGIAVVVFAIIDFLLPKRLKEAGARA
jgi:uncharacterized iron-regulated membrane protein